ncbi:MAG: 4-(cytidine 5'-diphospho)-2-C-methyl-D-erythritol kinase [Bacteroidota bacterium]|nr:4-(cytidine 5'-diphospho)-2-C-methyl-D-erythritol kinase [Bacteroidota bacterium]
MLVFPNAKINLGLYITGKRPDGYHSLESIFYPVPFLTDIAEVIESKAFTFDGLNLPAHTSAEDNLAVKAWRLLEKEYHLPPVSMYLAKKIPVGAGLGGGSADAAFALRALSSLFKLGLSTEKLEHFAAMLGSDCPFFIANKPAFVTGRGEYIQPAGMDLAGYRLSVVFPGIHIATKEAFSGITVSEPEMPLPQMIKKPAGEWKNTLENAFEKTIFPKYPVLKEIKETLYSAGALYSSMSGSGSALYALSEKSLDAKKLFPQYSTWEGSL